MTAVCGRCHATLEADVPEGLCPRCLMALALPEQATTTPPLAFVAPAPAELAPLFPQLEVLELLGQGGMGAVYKARQVKLDRLVALKVLPPAVAKDPGFADRFLREARALAKLSHPNIVAVHDFGDVEGLYYLVMEFIDGVNLRQALAEGKLEPQRALPLVAGLCAALQYAHEVGVVHRDIKPENVLLDRQGQVKVADFGLAKLVGQTQAARLTGTGQAMGTPHYMAPEQWEHPLEVDHRADIYSLGVVFYEVLTGELPLGKFAPPSQKAGVDARLDGVVLRAMERQPEQRYQKMSEMKTAIESVSQQSFARPGAGNIQLHWDDQAAITCGFVAAFLFVGAYIWWWPPQFHSGASRMDFLGGLFELLLSLPIAFFLGLLLVGLPAGLLVKGVLTLGRALHHWLLAGWAGSVTEVAQARPLTPPSGLAAGVETLWQFLKKLEHDRRYYPQLSVLPDIDKELLTASRTACRVPPDDRVLGVLDLSGGEGDPALLFGCHGLCWRNGDDSPHPGVRSLTYAELADRRPVNHGDAIYLGGELYLCPNEDEAGVAAEDIVDLLCQARDLMALKTEHATQARPPAWSCARRSRSCSTAPAAPAARAPRSAHSPGRTPGPASRS